MHAAKFLVKLYSVPDKEGAITAIDTVGEHFFAATERGLLLHFSLQVTPASPLSASSSTVSLSCYDAESARPPAMYTTLVSSTRLGGRVSGLRCGARGDSPVLFINCDGCLSYASLANLEQRTTIARGVDLFHVTTVDADSSSSSYFDHCVCVTETNSKNLCVIDVSCAHGTSVSRKQFLLPQQPLALAVTAQDVAYVAMEQEYCSISLTDGTVRSVVDFDAQGGERPLIALDAAADALCLYSRGRAHCLPLSPSSTSAGTEARASVSVVDGGAEQPSMLVVCFPFVLSFSRTRACRAHSFFFADDAEGGGVPSSHAIPSSPTQQPQPPSSAEGEEIAALVGVTAHATMDRTAPCASGDDDDGGCVFVAGESGVVWLLALNSLRFQLAELTENFKTEEALALLRAREGRSAAYGSDPRYLAGLRRELRVMAGFMYLHYGMVAEAFSHFEYGSLSPYDLLVHFKEAFEGPAGAGELDGLVTGRCRVSCEAMGAAASGAGAEVAFADQSRASYRHFSAAWADGPSVYNTFADSCLSNSWRETFESLPPAPLAEEGSTSGAPRRVSPVYGGLTLEEYVAHCWEDFQRHALDFLRGTLTRLGADAGARGCGEGSDNGEEDQRARVRCEQRAVECGVVFLSLALGCYSDAYSLLCSSTVLEVHDVCGFLQSQQEQRLLALVLLRHGQVERALECIRQLSLPSSSSSSSLTSWTSERDNYWASFERPAGASGESLAAIEERIVERIHKAIASTLRLTGNPQQQQQQDSEGGSLVGRSLMWLPLPRKVHLMRQVFGHAPASDAQESAALQLYRRFTDFSRRYATHVSRPQRLRGFLGAVVYTVQEVDDSGEATGAARRCVIPSLCETETQVKEEEGEEEGEEGTAVASPLPLPSVLSEAFFLVEKRAWRELDALLLERPALAHGRDTEGNTLLHYSVVYGDSVEALLQLVHVCAHHGCAPNLLNIYGHSCFDLLGVSGRWELLDVLTACVATA